MQGLGHLNEQAPLSVWDSLLHRGKPSLLAVEGPRTPSPDFLSPGSACDTTAWCVEVLTCSQQLAHSATGLVSAMSRVTRKPVPGAAPTQAQALGTWSALSFALKENRPEGFFPPGCPAGLHRERARMGTPNAGAVPTPDCLPSRFYNRLGTAASGWPLGCSQGSSGPRVLLTCCLCPGRRQTSHVSLVLFGFVVLAKSDSYCDVLIYTF